MTGIGRDNPALMDVTPKGFVCLALDEQRIGHLIDMTSNIKLGNEAAPQAKCSVTPMNTSARSLSVAKVRRGRVLHAAPRGQSAGRDTRDRPRLRVRPPLRFIRQIRDVEIVLVCNVDAFSGAISTRFSWNRSSTNS